MLHGRHSHSAFNWDAVILCLPAASYYAFGGIGYSQLGTHFNYDRPVTSELPPGLWSSLANAGLLAHCIIAYMVWNAHALYHALIRERHVLHIWAVFSVCHRHVTVGHNAQCILPCLHPLQCCA